MKIEKDRVVSIEYTLKDDGGQVIDTSNGKAPLAYLHGRGHIIPGLENELEGKEKGDKFQITIAPDQAYGQRNDQMIQAVSKKDIPDVDTVVVGSQFQVDTEQGPMIFTVIEIRDDELILDGNHPLAGMTLHFEVEVAEVREATQEELDHGHAHGPGGHNH